MDKRFIIIHPHEIIRKGLWAILRESFHFEFVLLNSVEALKDYSGLKNLFLVVFLASELDSKNTKTQIHELLALDNTLQIIPMYLSSLECSPHEISISQDEPAFAITETVKKLFNKQKPVQKSMSDLSEREKDVLAQVALGFTNKEIADKLFISIHTVISHRKNITEKLGIKSISGLTVYAILNKLIDTENIDPASLI